MKSTVLKSGHHFAILIFAMMFVCQASFAAGGKGNVKQLGKKMYIWHFDEGKGKETEDATDGLVGTFTGNIKWAEGISGDALEFGGKVGGAQYVEIPHSDEVDIDEALTMAAWVYPNEPPGDKFTIFFKLSYYMQLEPNGGSIAYYFYETAAPGYHLSSEKVPIKEWSHVAVVWDGKEINFYINGKKDASVIKQGGIGRSNRENIKIGGENAGCCPRFFQGRIDEVMLANYALSGADIERMMNETLAVDAKDKLATTWGQIKGR